MLTQLDVAPIRAGLSVPTPMLNALVLKFGGSAEEPIQIKGIEGLVPVSASISTSPLSFTDGESYSGSSVGKRNIVLTLGLNPNWEDQTMEGLRQLLYRYFMPKCPVRLTFASTHLPTCAIDGYVESMDPNMFSKDPEIQVSVICPKPDFVATTETAFNGSVITSFNLSDFQSRQYVGSVPAGVEIEVRSSAARPSYTGSLSVIIANPDAVASYFSQYQTADPVTIDATQLLEMSSVPGNKYFRNRIIAGGPNVNLLGVLSESAWPKMQPGENRIAIVGESPNQDWVLSYFARFGGL